MKPAIRLLKTHDEYHQAEKLQEIVWGFEDRELVPLSELVVAQKIGGFTIGAFNKKRLIGFCFGVPAYSKDGMYHYSRMLGVLPKYQGENVGYRLKLKQRELVLKQGLKLIRWTFDPLQSRNAYFNIVKLGVVISEYIPDIYGRSTSRFNKGLQTDRFLLHWWIRSKRVIQRLKNVHRKHGIENYAPLIKTKISSGGFVEPVKILNCKSRFLSVEVPSNIDDLKQDFLGLARKWRSITRDLFQSLFKRGDIINDFSLIKDQGTLRSFYLIEKV